MHYLLFNFQACDKFPKYTPKGVSHGKNFTLSECLRHLRFQHNGKPCRSFECMPGYEAVNGGPYCDDKGDWVTDHVSCVPKLTTTSSPFTEIRTEVVVTDVEVSTAAVTTIKDVSNPTSPFVHPTPFSGGKAIIFDVRFIVLSVYVLVIHA